MRLRFRSCESGFTMLEVLVAVLMLTLLVMGVAEFVQTAIKSSVAATKLSNDRQELSGLISFVQSALNEIPGRGRGTLMGTESISHDMHMDEMQWVCGAGPGLMTTAGDSEYFVTLTIQRPDDKNAKGYEIGLRRRLTESREGDYTWLPLLSPAAGLQIEYYYPAVTQWVRRWSDQATRPSLVRISIWRTEDEQPYVAILDVPAARVQQQ